MHLLGDGRNLAGLVLVLYCLPLSIHCLRFHLQPNTKRCLKEEMRKDVLVTGEYTLSDSPGVRTDLLVSPYFENDQCESIL